MLRGWVVAVVLAVGATPAHAYEFWLRAHTIGQAYQLREYRLIGPDLFQGRRRYTQTLALRIWDVGDLAAARRRARLPERGLRVSWQSYLRVDHDFGQYTAGRIRLSPALRRDAIDVIPELADSVAGFQLLYGYLELAGIGDDRATVRLGRVLADEGWGATGVDGGSVRVELPPPLAVTATGGLRVRAASPLGVSAYELDGTSGAGCREYVEAATPGAGAWRLIDRDRVIRNTRLGSDFEYCPQREVAQPTVGVTLATSRLRRFGAELGYRRTWSRTVGIIGDPNRFAFPDVGLYPDESGQAPGSGVNEERVHARVHGEVRAAGLALRPFGNARVSLLHGVLDRADAGVRVERGRHAVEPALEYFYPTFDGDSIWNAFSIEPTVDARLGYRYDGIGSGGVGGVRATANAWLRRYLGGAGGGDADGAGGDGGGGATSGGLDASIERPLTRWWRVRADALWDDGYGGRRAGGSGEAAWQRRDRMLWVRGRVVVLGVAPDDRARYVDASAVVSTTWRVAEAVAIHAIAEADIDAQHDLHTRAIAVLDLAFMPEP
ncbi:MAG TPA: hypothetical protein VNO30_16030 [Kofleriaceae bacterium]|nr:hypothetical protein [Kofleriaceae bacterium]